jgi:hypothetical protein
MKLRLMVHHDTRPQVAGSETYRGSGAVENTKQSNEACFSNM